MWVSLRIRSAPRYSLEKATNAMKTLDELITQEERAAIRAPIEQARTLPRRTFIDRDFYDLEVEHALKESWFAVTFTTEIAGPGCLLPLVVLGTPVLLVRDRDGIVRAFHNVCPLTQFADPVPTFGLAGPPP